MMKYISKIGRSIKLLFGWILTILFGITFIYALFNGDSVGTAVLVSCFLLTALGVWMIISAKRSRKAELKMEREAAKRAAANVPKKKVFVTAVCPSCGATMTVERTVSASVNTAADLSTEVHNIIAAPNYAVLPLTIANWRADYVI